MHYAFHIRIYGLILDKYGRRKNMGKYLLKRILQAIGVIFCIYLITFFVLNIVPGNPVEIMLGEQADQATMALFTHEIGLDKPMVTQYIFWFTTILLYVFRVLSCNN